MKRPFFAYAAALALAGLIAAGCDLLDPSGVTNPEVTEASALAVPAVGAPWLSGLQRQAVLVYSSFLPAAETGSDNYTNVNNFFLADDNLDFVNEQHPDVRDFQFTLADLRESATFGLTEIRARDEDLTDDQLAEFHFYEGLSHLLAGMYFKTLPAEDGGAPVSGADHLARALTSFDAALALSSDAAVIPSYHLAKARAHFYLGNRAEAAAAANAALAAGGDAYVRYLLPDALALADANGEQPDSEIEDAVWERTTTDFQPLPRLDFLDPKFNDFDRSNYDTPIPMLKIEEAYLIRAQAELAGGDLTAAKNTMKSVLAVVAARPVETIIDTDRRTSRSPGSRPNTSDWQVRRTPEAPLESGLVLTRAAGVEIEVPIVSGTSVTAAEVDAAASAEDALYLLYLLRQEIFFGEGLRLADLGVRLPVHEDEALTNPNVNTDDRQGVIPAFLPRGAFDAATFDFTAQQATIQHDLNAILVANRASDLVVPFF